MWSSISSKIIASSLFHSRVEEFQRMARLLSQPDVFQEDEDEAFESSSDETEDEDSVEEDVVFLEKKNEDEILALKFEEAKREGRYVDLTENEKFEEAKREGRYVDLSGPPPLPPGPPSLPPSEKESVKKSCPICLEVFLPQDVTFLDCLHTVCTNCISNMRKHEMRQRCPICRHPF